jgi:hypothetical protein
MEDVLLKLVETYPFLLGIVSFIGTSRLIFKPLMVFLEKIVVSTKTTKDDELLAKFKGSKWYKWINLLFDYIFSIKLPK